jgi:hypothetical protein
MPLFAFNADFNQISSVLAKCRKWQAICSLEFEILDHYLICVSLIANLSNLGIVYQDKSWLHTRFIEFQRSKNKVLETVTLGLHHL